MARVFTESREFREFSRRVEIPTILDEVVEAVFSIVSSMMSLQDFQSFFPQFGSPLEDHSQ
jgi:hypothetical protein